MRPVAVGLTLQSHGAEGAGDVALRSGRRQRGAPDVAHLGGDEKRQHTLARGKNRNEIGRTNAQCARGQRSPACRHVEGEVQLTWTMMPLPLYSASSPREKKSTKA